MDPFKRGPLGLRRFFRAHELLGPEDARRPGGSVREFATEAREHDVRTLIQRKVVTFVPPSLPLADANIQCTNAIVELIRTGKPLGMLRIAADIKTDKQQKVAFIIGFATNKDAYWVSMFGALNFDLMKRGALSTGNTLLAYGHGDSAWLERNFHLAREHGVTFRILSTTDMSASPRALLAQWCGKFGQPLGRPLGRYDMSEEDAWPEAPQISGGESAERGGDDDDNTLSVRVRLIFE